MKKLQLTKPYMVSGLMLVIVILALSAKASLSYHEVADVSLTTPPPSYTGSNPSPQQIRALLVKAGQTYHIPPTILFGIAEQESGWRQFNSHDATLPGRTVYHIEAQDKVGVGIMQVAVSPSACDYQRLCTDIAYNIDRGAAILGDPANPDCKWATTPPISDNDRAKLENWYYAVWAYNGFVAGSEYPQKIYSRIAHCTNDQWQDVQLTVPVAPDTGDMQAIRTMPTPYHVDANFDGTIDSTCQASPLTDVVIGEVSGASIEGTQVDASEELQLKISAS